ncbi:MAG: ABC transporter permease [Chloroflexi bacterium]|nr:ABC transporter permease [Chloroflexota bacterium]
MLRKIFAIAALHLKTTYQSRSALLFGLAMPVVFTLVIGAAIGQQEGPAAEAWELFVVNEDRGELGSQLVQNLEANPVLEVRLEDAETTRAELDAEEISAGLFIPEDFSARLLDGESLSLDFIANIKDALSGQVVEQAVQAALNELASSIDIAAASLRVATRLGLFEPGLAGAPSEADYQREAIDSARARMQSGPPITVQAIQQTQRKEPGDAIPLGFNQSSPGIAVIFAMFFVMAGTSSLVVERERGTLSRLMTAPVSKGIIMAGKLLGVYISASVQFAIMVLFGVFALGVDWGAEPPGIILMILAFTFSITGLGILVASMVRTSSQIDAVSTILIMPLAGLGGAMWPLEIVPQWMQQLAVFLPSGLAMRGFHDLITRGLGLQDVLLEAGALVAFGVVFLAVGAWRFKYE